jgi:hypothetical protein
MSHGYESRVPCSPVREKPTAGRAIFDVLQNCSKTDRAGPRSAVRLDQRAHNPLVLGSNPSGPTIKMAGVRKIGLTARLSSTNQLKLFSQLLRCQLHMRVGGRRTEGAFSALQEIEFSPPLAKASRPYP